MNVGKQFAFLYGANESKNLNEIRNIAYNLYQGSRSVRDQTVTKFLNALHDSNYNNKWDMQKIFVNEFASWIGTDMSAYDVDYSAGTTQSFDSFYLRHRNKKFRCYTGEYFYHLKTWTSNDILWSFVTDIDQLQSGDALVLSFPFCDTGNFYDINTILDTCESLDIPVLIDMAYYPLTNAPTFRFYHTCIDTVTFSLSKIFPIANYRIGVRYTKKDTYDGQKLHDDINYNNFASCYLGYELIKKYNVNYIASTYRQKQSQVSKVFDITPSDSVIFALGNEDWDTYSRRTLLDAYKLQFAPENFENRICLNTVYENWRLFNELEVTL